MRHRLNGMGHLPSKMQTPRISYCSPLMNRHWQLRETLAANLRCVAAFKGAVDWVIVNIRRADDVSGTDWQASHDLILSEGAVALAAGHLLYYTTVLPEWNPSWGKNLGLFLGRGDFLINLDIDNFISIKDTAKLLGLDLDRMIYHGFDGTYGNGTHGMVGTPRSLFFAVGGYKEDLIGYGGDDWDFLTRAHMVGRLPVQTFATRKTIQNDADQRTANIRCTTLPLEEQNRLNVERARAAIAAGQMTCENSVTRQCVIHDHQGTRVALNSA